MTSFTCPNCNAPFGAQFITGATTPHRYSVTTSDGSKLAFDLCDGCHIKFMRKPSQAAKRYPLIARKVARAPGEYVSSGGAA